MIAYLIIGVCCLFIGQMLDIVAIPECPELYGWNIAFYAAAGVSALAAVVSFIMWAVRMGSRKKRGGQSQTFPRSQEIKLLHYVAAQGNLQSGL